MQETMDYLLDHPLLGVLVIGVAWVVVTSIVKSLFKAATILVVVALALVVFFDFTPKEVLEKGSNVANIGTSLFQKTLQPMLTNESEGEAFFIQEKNGDTVISLDSLGITYNLSELFESEEEKSPMQQKNDASIPH
ncbi:hypothetical protein KO561_06125 [Radiobacillus kanasensis]|uniref:hypothetical protein n=1 Tax=Radiobacillus kanasensis TaxID=2844358 RepID=UPI001E39FE71|nr:hypothetical protein [Radiobacillus kanasensis]UFU00516.1 hypothetical protein KO561_06125 [Radiobacillus kanasensis]